MSEENASGQLTRTYLALQGHIEGSDPATGDYHYYLHDILDSVRLVYDESIAEEASLDYSPFGNTLREEGAQDQLLRYTGEEWDPTANLYHFFFRTYSPTEARWSTREPAEIDGPNLYHYAMNNPSSAVDILGLMTSLSGCKYDPPVCAVITEGSAAGRKAGRLYNKAYKRYKKLRGKCQKHHLFPQFMGGHPKAATVAIPAAYHQLISNEFHVYMPKGKSGKYRNTPTAKAKSIMDKVYKKYPVPKGGGAMARCK